MASSSSIDELPSSAAETLTSQTPSTTTEPLPMETSSIEINGIPSATKTLTPLAPVEPIPMETSSIEDLHPAPVEPIQSSDSNPTDNIEAVGEKRKRADDEKTDLESSETKVTLSPWWKTSLCSYFRREASCSHGNECKYAHGEAELRMKPDNTWDPTSERGKKAKAMKMTEQEVNEDEEVLFTEQMMESIDDDGSVFDLSLSKCLVHLPRKWQSDELKTFLREQGVHYKSAKKRRGMMVGFVTFENAEQLQSGVEVLDGKTVNSNNLKIADVLPRTFDKKETKKSVKSAREAVTPLADLSYADQLEQKKASVAQMLKKLARSARKACPNGGSLPVWVLTSRDRGGLSCNLEGIIESPITDGYRNKCEFSVGLSVLGKPTVGFSLGNFCAGVTAVEEPVNCPNISKIALQYASIFQKVIEKSKLQVWNRFHHSGFWRQFTVREGRKPGVFSNDEDAVTRIAEVMLIVQVCLTGSDEAEVATEFKEMAKAFAEGARASSPTLPLTVLVVQNHTGISNVAPPDAPLQVLPIPMSDNGTNQEQATNVLTEARIHDHINNLRFSISPTAFFQVNTVTAEKLYSVAGDWADLGPDTLLFDVCCGTGTIGLTLAHRVGMVIGIEMNASAVVDAERNATINGISNCKFICAKAESVMSSLLKQYLDMTEMEEANPLSNANDKQIPSTEEMSNSKHVADQNLPPPNTGVEDLQDNAQKDSSSIEPEKSIKPQFKNVVAIVDPPRSGLHPAVIKALRTHPRLKRLVYISCNPETLVANAIELCTPSFVEADRGNKNYRGNKRIGIAGLARRRAQSMPTSEPFRPVKAMAVDLFPHTDHCEMVMLLER
ncbi:PREDICTED: zinc finger CCCH domain-containing protein 24-like isoform X2 [Camelina sativa]|uniref:Zinc finger CCCH domain-containing protein 24-like isoform X1 n=1 Tax=Camelina sativa TaxID=90675 RepID=A0ABM0SQ80_CAMSA|nr:PREDICTED: zinc finger CCCH domain-containing protein 24-like isoform X1 [Camelina sativa]XP_010414524.1 PREDICTED: zinc finger CCCH domain-containing protein 24-like isoform X2 [Camelina sativa]